MGFEGGALRWNGAGWQNVGSIGGQRVRDLHVHDDGTGPHLYASGNFSVNGVPGTTDLARWNGSAWSAVGSGTGTDIATVALGTFDSRTGLGAELWVSGDFTAIHGLSAAGLAAWDGATWRRPDAEEGILSSWPGSPVHAIGSWSDESGRLQVAVGGDFHRAGSVPAEYIALWDGVAWSPLGSGTNGRVDAIQACVDPASGEQALFVGGMFTAAGGLPSPGIARWNDAGWSALQGGVDGMVFDVTRVESPALGGPALYVGGYFATLGGQTANSIARWDGTSWSMPTGGLTIPSGHGVANALLEWDDPGLAGGPQLYVAGVFTKAGGNNAYCAARWDGASWTEMSSGVLNGGSMHDFAVFDAGNGEELFAVDIYGRVVRWNGASWIQLMGQPATFAGDRQQLIVHDDGTGPALYTGLVHWNAAGWSTPSTMVSPGPINALASIDPGNGRPVLWVGGGFAGIDGVASRSIARYSDPCATLASYCTAKTNSLGCVPAISWSGTPSVSQSAGTPFVVTSSDVINNKNGLFFYGCSGRRAAPFQGGTLCVAAPLRRTPIVDSAGNPPPNDCSGVLALDFTPWIQGAVDPQLGIGVLVDGQWWYRDPAGTKTIGLSDALEIEIQP